MSPINDGAQASSSEDAGAAESGGRPERRIVFVVGSGRSGTSALSGALKILGMTVPQPEVGPDDTNPKGFGESLWVVRFHDEMLRRSNVLIGDARPGAWFDAGKLSTVESVREELTQWLGKQFEGGATELIIKDPRLVWFVGLWRVAAARHGASVSYVIMLRPPHEVIGSKRKYYPSLQSELTRVCGWANLMLHAERATRGENRIFIDYHALLEDWTVPVYDIGERFDLASVKSATAADIRRVHAFIDPSLRRVRSEDSETAIPKRLGRVVEETWRQLSALVDLREDQTAQHSALDELRAEYYSLYEEAEAIAQSTTMAVRRRVEHKAAKDLAKREAALSPVHGPAPARAGRWRRAVGRARRTWHS